MMEQWNSYPDFVEDSCNEGSTVHGHCTIFKNATARKRSERHPVVEMPVCETLDSGSYHKTLQGRRFISRTIANHTKRAHTHTAQATVFLSTQNPRNSNIVANQIAQEPNIISRDNRVVDDASHYGTWMS